MFIGSNKWSKCKYSVWLHYYYVIITATEADMYVYTFIFLWCDTRCTKHANEIINTAVFVWDKIKCPLCQIEQTKRMGKTCILNWLKMLMSLYTMCTQPAAICNYFQQEISTHFVNVLAIRPRKIWCVEFCSLPSSTVKPTQHVESTKLKPHSAERSIFVYLGLLTEDRRLVETQLLRDMRHWHTLLTWACYRVML